MDELSSQNQPSQRRRLPRSAAVLGALLSALSVVYAASLLGALVGAAIFFLFYRQLTPPRGTAGSTPAPGDPARPHSSRNVRAA